MRSCKDVSFLVSESLDRTLSIRERLGLKTHLLMCKACQRMARQMELISAASHRIASEERLSKEASERILDGVRKAQRDHAHDDD